MTELERMNSILSTLSRQVQELINKTPNPLFSKIDPFIAMGFSSTTVGSPIRRVVALGNNPDINAGTIPEDIWSGGGLYPWMTTTTSLEIVSSVANDSSADTGARTVLISGLRDDFTEISQVVSMNGLTPVPIPTGLFRIQSAAPTTAGSFGTNQGNLIIRDAGGGTTRAIVPAGYGIIRQSQFTVPSGYGLQIVSFLTCINRPSGTLDATLATYSRVKGGPYRLPLEVSVDGNPYRHDGLPGIGFTEGTDFGFRCTFASSNNMDITGAFLGVLIRNDYLNQIVY